MVEEFKSVEVVQIPADGGVSSIDFEGVQRFVSAGVASGLKEAK